MPIASATISEPMTTTAFGPIRRAARAEYIPARNIVTDDGSRISPDSVTDAPNP